MTDGRAPLPAAPPAHRFVAVGASNLARGALALLDAARAAAGAPLEAHLALGRGRSFGLSSRLLGRGLGSIRDAGLWAALAAAPPRPTTALLMDVGNDLLYGVDVPTLLQWVDDVLGRLAALRARLVVVGLPLPAIATLGAFRFGVVRTVLVPSCQQTLATLQARALATHHGLAALAASHGAAFHELPGAWYGLDPIHIRRRHWPTAAASWLGAPRTATPPLDSFAARLRFLFAAPAERTWFGRVTTCPQPIRRWPDGSSLALW